MKDNLDISDARLIIRNLMTFIVVEGKGCVDDQKKKEYVSGYIQVLIKTINLIDEGKDFTLVEDIADDIARYLK
ncbi:hypothetical protein D1816_12195 [Aquimarina sp. AD10]|uniref:Uncharacterized protein n=1 Tax=Aquimarina aggregata TaxID=1642818 RepID=A0A162YJH8_9FLAO|nr:MULTISPECIES: hypothetical protein [Aquimarina]AXT61077.1 hypothetical protein D1816_12195 [Aquimarina sp. AD10]KZS39175.1 hypothetical protein AWE51_11505 [Aquimarina aggregata]RKM92748.1 hypothetical protein D7033_20570 [Aquimarina sp. AD10]